MVKKFLPILVIAVIAISVSACGRWGNEPPNNQTSDNITLTVSTRKSDRFLQYAAAAFQGHNPEIKVDIKEVATSSEDNANDYVNTMNAQILSGKGTDIIDVSGLPYQKYADKKALVNLSDMIKNDRSFDANNYYPNILDVMKYKGNLYVMPVCFTTQALIANGKVLDDEGIKIDDNSWTWNDFKDIAKKVTKDLNGDGAIDRFALPALDNLELFSDIYITNNNKFVNVEKKQAHFDTGEFANLLNFVKSLTDEKLVNPQADKKNMFDAASRGTVVFMFYPFKYYINYAMINSVFDGHARILNYPSDGQKGGGFFAPVQGRIFAINSKSRNKDKAWDFIKYLLSNEMQTSQDLGAFPVNVNASTQMAASDIKMSANSGFSEQLSISMGGLKLNYRPLTQQDVDVVNGYINKLMQNPDIDQKILSIIIQELNPFFEGKRNAYETARIVQRKVETYLNE